MAGGEIADLNSNNNNNNVVYARRIIVSLERVAEFVARLGALASYKKKAANRG